MKLTREFYIPMNYSKVEVPEKLPLEIWINEDELTIMYFEGRKQKPSKHIRYNSNESLQNAVDTLISNAEHKLQSVLMEKAVKKEKTLKIAEKIKVGDIFVYSWGWEQTNVNFYQVVEKSSPMTVVVREIGYETIEETSWASENVRPIKDSFISDELEKVRINSYGRFNRSCGSAFKVENPETSKHYRSWYA